MALKRLSLEDVDQLKLLVNSRRNVRDLLDDDVSNLIEYRVKWLEGMKRYYLVGKDTHYLYGYFSNDGQLVSCMGWRCDLPDPWDDGWVVGHLKTLPGYSIRRSGMIELWNIMFDICESKGLRRWHMLIPESNRDAYQMVADKFFNDIDSTYTYDWTLVIPARTQPEIDWVWGTMGRVLHDKEIRLRTGTKKT